MLLCKHCNKECKNENSLRNHERLCPSNHERVYVSHTLGKTAWNKGLTKLDPRVAKYAESSSKSHTGKKCKPHSEESKRYRSELAKKNGLGGHTSKFRMMFKKKDGSIVYLQSSYEIKLAEIFEELNIIWTRPEPLYWLDDEGINHRYYPDFKVGERYFDTKNDYLAKIDARKIQLVSEQNDVDLRILLLPQITKEYIAGIV